MRVDKIAATLTRYLGIDHLYTWLLSNEVKRGKLPSHIAVILDGNRRWAVIHEYPKWMGHAFGAEKVEQLFQWCLTLKIRSLTLYVLSIENLKRSQEELAVLFDLLEERLEKLISDRIVEKHAVRVKAMGDLSLLPQKIREQLIKLEEISDHYDDLYLNLAIAYGGRLEIIDAVKRIAQDVTNGTLNPSHIDEEMFSRYLFTSHLPHPDPDLIIRTSGEIRLSGFLLWQSAYSELVFMDVYWPSFRKMDFLRAIRTYQRRQRRFGR